MIYPLVKEMAAVGAPVRVPVAVACRILGFSKQGYYNACWDPHAWNPTSDHPKGRACDIVFGSLGHFPKGTDKTNGDRLAEWLVANADTWGVNYVIWQGRVWSSARAQQGWRPYTGGGIYNPADATGGHFDHIHLSQH